jgi:hypothetical protein
MIYSWCTFLDCYSMFSPLQAYFLPTHGNGEVLVLEKLPYGLFLPGSIDAAMRPNSQRNY